MTVNEKLPISMDWERTSFGPAEDSFINHACSVLLSIYSSQADEAGYYKSLKRQRQLKTIITPLVLSAWDGYLSRRSLLIEKSEEADAFCRQFGLGWKAIAGHVSTLSKGGILKICGSNESGATTFEVIFCDGLEGDLDQLKSDALECSLPIDVHRWSVHPEVNKFVDFIYDRYFLYGNMEIRKKHIKVLLLDLYIRWSLDPALKITVARSPNEYKAKTRYNELHISKLTPEIVDRLEEVGLLRQAIGYYDREKASGKTTRVWPTGRLIRLFLNAKFGTLDVICHADREVIILRDEDRKDIEYDDTAETKRMREGVRAYNKLIARTFVDIATLENNFIDLGSDRKGQPNRLHITQNDKFTRRIFNRSSFEKGGRFFGGWWQRCPKEWREYIYIDGRPTIEIDYSGLHIVILYANEGIDYVEQVGDDPYVIDPAEFDFGPKELRAICKTLVLVALNAPDDKSAFRAFRYESENGSSEKKMTDKQLGKILDVLRKKHLPIAKKFATDAGIDLMRQDAQIAECIIDHFTNKGVPVLSIHDSFIVPIEFAEALRAEMQKAFTFVTGVTLTETQIAWVDGIHKFPSNKLRTVSIPILGLMKNHVEYFPRISERYSLGLQNFKNCIKNR